MQKVPGFEIFEKGDKTQGVFDWGNDRRDLLDAYYDASDLYNSGELEEAEDILKKTIEENPQFIDGYNLLGNIETDLGNFEEGVQCCKKALEIGQKIIPESFEGKISWGFTENRPFLRAMHSVALNYANDLNHVESIRLMEQLLDYNPNDNQGIRYLIGDQYFLHHSFKNAQEVYEKNLDYPPYLYSYGLLHLSLGNYTKAIYYWRKAIFRNIYISEYLRMNMPLIDYKIWHQSNFERPETAYDYMDLMATKWLDFPAALDILQFLHTTEPTQSEIKIMYMLKEELFVINNYEDEKADQLRSEILNEIKDVENYITEDSSKKLKNRWQENPPK